MVSTITVQRFLSSSTMMTSNPSDIPAPPCLKVPLRYLDFIGCGMCRPATQGSIPPLTGLGASNPSNSYNYTPLGNHDKHFFRVCEGSGADPFRHAPYPCSLNFKSKESS